MFKCHYTCVDLAPEQAFVLDLRASHRALARVRRQLHALERLIATLGEPDQRDYYDAKRKLNKTGFTKRVISAAVADALAAVEPSEPLFLTFPDWLTRRRQGARDRAAARKASKEEASAATLGVSVSPASTEQREHEEGAS